MAASYGTHRSNWNSQDSTRTLFLVLVFGMFLILSFQFARTHNSQLFRHSITHIGVTIVNITSLKQSGSSSENVSESGFSAKKEKTKNTPPNITAAKSTAAKTTQATAVTQNNPKDNLKVFNGHGKLGATSNDSCPETSPRLVGKVPITNETLTALPWEELQQSFPEISLGGVYKTRECRSRYDMGIVIPYRARDEHLRIWLRHMIPILKRQQLDFAIYIVEQLDGSVFNRGMLMNIGFAEAMKARGHACFVFTDIDLILEDDRNIYGCPDMPRHMSVAVDTFGYRLPYATIFGGIENFRSTHYKHINGFSNKYFGWGGEDDDLYTRVVNSGLKLIRPDINVARYTMIKHKKDHGNPNRFKYLRAASSRIKKDGISTLKYTVKTITKTNLFTKISVTIDQKAILSS